MIFPPVRGIILNSMNFKKAFLFGVILWVFIFAIFSIVMFIPWFIDRTLAQYIVLWILEIPVTLALAKWYFSGQNSTWKKGLQLGLAGIVVGTLLDMIITVPLFVRSYYLYYTSWMLYAGYVLVLVLCVYAGWEFDKEDWQATLDKK